MSKFTIRTVAVDCNSFDVAPVFWKELLGMKVTSENDHWLELEPISADGPKLAFQLVPERKVAKNRLHFDIEVPDLAVATAHARELGAVPDGEVAGTAVLNFQIMLDPAGNEFCLFEKKTM